ncbi:hypothetical protein AB4084_36925, partial [Lysobacter sp. 2RAB21]
WKSDFFKETGAVSAMRRSHRRGLEPAEGGGRGRDPAAVKAGFGLGEGGHYPGVGVDRQKLAWGS